MGIQDKAEDLGDAVADAAQDAGTKARQLADDVADRAQDTAERVGDRADDARRSASRAASDAGRKVEGAASHVSDRVEDAVDEVREGHGVVNRLHRLGLRSEWAYAGAFASIGVSLGSWLISRGKTGDDKSQSDRWGIFIGHWAPTFMALGVALKLEEKR
ncbi:hypothetical protein ACFFOM_11450 [Microlunatus capsulatus]|uniref:ElaB/YqjD/DUF883 family membrane-anchored ribosome-binding protein n=1 Tax=Microlunatus capsulatus TaxID=99117 RepID=A0ABS4Z9C0_9ACTN|nr:hypothetical protein [Microlunatus capsulatus]MBP2417640.1 ElaB/YqjD/DUF883 family membrane-anchored ribosome-binding protein [Microlunatus capsulatus]